MIESLITSITAKVGIPAPLAEKAVGMILSYVQRAEATAGRRRR